MLSTDAPKHLLVVRVAIAQAALDTFLGQPFAWGSGDCAKLAAFVMSRAGLSPNLHQFGSYRTDRMALRALKGRKFRTVVDWVDSVKGVERIAPAACLPGDLIAFPGEGGWHGLTVYLGNRRVLGFTETATDGACSIIAANMQFAEAAWKVSPWRKS